MPPRQRQAAAPAEIFAAVVIDSAAFLRPYEQFDIWRQDMTKRLLHTVLIASTVHLSVLAASDADVRWHRHAPEGAGFSVEVPSEPKSGVAPGEYEYSSGFWTLGVKIRPVDPGTRRMVERRDRKALERCLESIRDSTLSAVTAKPRDSSTGEIDGYPSIRFSFEFPVENMEFEASNLLVLTSEHLYILMTVGPKGLPNDDAKRFLRSFRLVTADAGMAPESRASSVASSNPLVAKMAEPTLAVARLVIEERMKPQIDEAVQQAPPAAHLGNRWSPSNPAWQQARQSISSRIERLATMYGESGQAVRTVESELGKLTTESEATLTAALSGPADRAILRELARSQFVTMMMLRDPDGPKPGERAWQEKLRAMQALFDQRIGSAVPAGDRAHDAELKEFLRGPASDDVNRLFFEVVETATRELEGAINLMMFDESDAIRREIERAIASVK